MSICLPNAKNPLYGSGVFRRRIVYHCEASGARIWLYDDFHEMELTITVANDRVANVFPIMSRYPKDACPGAIAKLGAICGTEVAGARKGMRSTDASQQCTHLLDIAGLALSALGRRSEDYVAEISVGDDGGAGHAIIVAIDGAVQLDVLIEEAVIRFPDAMQGRSLASEFRRCLADDGAGLETDILRMAQMSLFVSQGRRWIVDGADRTTVGQEPAREGACHSFSRPAYPNALSMVDFTRDHSNGLPPNCGLPFSLTELIPEC